MAVEAVSVTDVEEPEILVASEILLDEIGVLVALIWLCRNVARSGLSTLD